MSAALLESTLEAESAACTGDRRQLRMALRAAAVNARWAQILGPELKG